MKTLWLCLLCWMLALPAQALEVHSFTLENGLDVVVVPDHRTPVVVHSVWYRAGSADEAAFADNATGIAHMLEHLMFKGTPNIPAGEFSKIVARLGGQDNAFTSRDYTAYYQKVGAAKLAEVMAMESERMDQLQIAEHTFAPERAVVAEERRMRVDSRPLGRFFEQLVAKHYGNHPYAHPVIGWPEDIEAYTLQLAQRWYATHYGPNNATLLVVGDVQPEQVLALAQQYYGPKKPVKVPARNWSELQKFETSKTLAAADAQVQVPVFYRLYRAPSAFAGIDGSPAASPQQVAVLQVLAQVLGGDENSLLYKFLVEQQKLATAVSLDYSPVSRGESTLDLFAQPVPGVSLAQLQQAIEKALAELPSQLTKSHLEQAKTQLATGWLYAQDDPFGVAYRLGRWLVAGGVAEDYDAWQKALPEVTRPQVVAAAEQYLLQGQWTTGLLSAKEME